MGSSTQRPTLLHRHLTTVHASSSNGQGAEGVGDAAVVEGVEAGLREVVSPRFHTLGQATDSMSP